MTTGSGGYDWKRPFRPPNFSFWIADHRVGVRALFFIIDVALVVMIILSLIRGEVWWQLYVQALLWPWLTYQAGWLVPATVDKWRSDQGASGASPDSGGS